MNFIEQYDAQVANLSLERNTSILGPSSGIFTNDTRVAIYSMGPYMGGEIISFSLFFKTSESGDQILFFYGNAFGVSSKKDIFFFSLSDGHPRLHFEKRLQRKVTPKATQSLNDGQWHQIAVSMPHKSCLRSEIQMFIDGKNVKLKVTGEDQYVFVITSGKLSLGGFGYSNHKFDRTFPRMKPFVGMMDNVWVWANPISANMLRSASKKKFINYQGHNCQPGAPRKYKRKKTKTKCRKLCEQSPSCWGYELKGKVGNKYKCYHQYEHPIPIVTNETAIRDMCVSAV